jgi:hypothetical protein
MATILPFSGGKRCIVCRDQIHPDRVRENPDIVTCEAGCAVQHETNVAALFEATSEAMSGAAATHAPQITV